MLPLTNEKVLHQKQLQEMEDGTNAVMQVEGTKRYKINEIFYSIQGEGLMSGTPAVFIRFSACNLACTWCDTEYNSGVKMSLHAILAFVKSTYERFEPEALPIIVLTGGEPSLQLDDPFVDHFDHHGYFITIETNGKKWNPAMLGLQLVTVSPKELDGWWREGHPELTPSKRVMKLVWDPSNPDMEHIFKAASRFGAAAHFLQPCQDQETLESNEDEVVDLLLRNGLWRMSLQTHKVVGLR